MELRDQIIEHRKYIEQLKEQGVLTNEEIEEEEMMFGDPEEDGLVAIKKIERVFDHKIFAQRALRELKILRLLQHENVLCIDKILKPKDP
jgi:serine/threonine protein kinase